MSDIKFCTASTFGASSGATGFVAKSVSLFVPKRYAMLLAAKKFAGDCSSTKSAEVARLTGSVAGAVG